MSGSFAPPAIGALLRLDYTAASDVANALALPAATWTDVGVNQSFSVGASSSVISVSVSGFINVNTSNGNGSNLAGRLVIDSASTPIIKIVSGCYIGTNSFDNVLSGTSPFFLTGLATGTHTVKVQVYAGNAAIAYCRPTTLPSESLSLRVVEHP